MDNFIQKKIYDDIAEHRVETIHTRFPPEPNGYLHIGHAKSIGLNFGIAKKINAEGVVSAHCNLRFDDTNPMKEKTEYLDSIKKDIQWLGWDWGKRVYYTSDYFPQLYEYALILIKKRLAYIDHSTPDDLRRMRGTPTKAGIDSPYRERSIEENLAWFEKMKCGEVEEGACLLRAKIDMAHANIVMRDPPIYRIKKTGHHRTKNIWCIYPMYDFAHCLSDAIEGITHSLCTLEFEIHRPLYEWFIEHVGIFSVIPQQIEFARLHITYMVMSKRKMKALIDNGFVDSWDDPRMATISGLRRRGYTPDAIRLFCEEIGITKTKSVQSLGRLEETLRKELNQKSTRIMAVFDPVKLIIENYDENKKEYCTAHNNKNDENAGTREMSFSKHLYIERDDIMIEPVKGFHRITVGQEVRLQYAYYITCTRIETDAAGNITTVYATYDTESKGGGTPDNRKVKGSIHWVHASDSIDIEIDILDVLFNHEFPDSLNDEYDAYINPDSLIRKSNVKVEPYILTLIKSYEQSHPYPFQCMRKGYIIFDAIKSKKEQKIVCNQSVSLKDSWKGK